MGLGAKREIYSEYEPSWRYAHAASIWIKGMEDEGVIPKSQEILKSSNTNEDLGYISEEEISVTFTWLIPKIMAKHNMNKIIAVAALKILITERADKKLIFTASGIILVQKYPLNLLMK